MGRRHDHERHQKRLWLDVQPIYIHVHIMNSTFDYRSSSLHLQICSFSVVLFTYFTPIYCLRQRMPVITHPSSPNHAERCVLNQSSIVRSIWSHSNYFQPSTSCHRLTSSARSSNTCISTTVRTGWQREDLWMGALRSTCSRSPLLSKLHQPSMYIIYEALMGPHDSCDAGGWL